MKNYQMELINSSKGIISVPIDEELGEVLQANEFIKCIFSGHAIRSSSVVWFNYIGNENET